MMSFQGLIETLLEKPDTCNTGLQTSLAAQKSFHKKAYSMQPSTHKMNKNDHAATANPCLKPFHGFTSSGFWRFVLLVLLMPSSNHKAELGFPKAAKLHG